jgi:long-subunit fatty acid transport protein
MTSQKYITLTSIISACVFANSLHAQFLVANSQEGMGYAVGLEQGLAVVQSASDFAVLNAHNAQSLSIGYGFTNLETDRVGARLFESDVDQHALHIRYGHAFGDLVAALQVSVFNSKADADYRDGPTTGKVELDSDGWFAAATAAYELNGFILGAIGGLGQLSNDSKRSSSAIPNVKTGSFNTKFYTLGVNGAYIFPVNEAFQVAPRVRLDYTKVDMDQINEQIVGAPLDRGNLNSSDRTWLIATVELLATYAVNEAFRFNSSLGWQYDFENSNTTLAGTDSGGIAGSVVLPDVGESVFRVGLGADYDINQRWSLGVSGSYLTGDNLTVYTVGAGVRYQF